MAANRDLQALLDQHLPQDFEATMEWPFFAVAFLARIGGSLVRSG